MPKGLCGFQKGHKDFRTPQGLEFAKNHLRKLKFNKGKHLSEKTKKKIKETIKNGYKNGRTTWNKGKKLGFIPKRAFKKGELIGEKNWNWKGGITKINDKIRDSLESKLWQDSVKNRDGNSCQKCGDNRIEKLTAHHILNFVSHIELRFAIDNGITFCRKCHNWFHRKYGIKNNTKEQVKEFLRDK